MLKHRTHRLRATSVAWMFFALLLPCAAQAQKMRITVGGADFKPYPVAVPALAVAGKDAAQQALAAQVLERLRFDVDLARHFSLVPANTYLSPASESAAKPQFGKWQNTGASGLIRGSIEPAGSRTQLTLRFFDVAMGKELVTRTCPAEAATAGRCVHQFLDQIIDKLTGEPGVFSSRIAFVRRVGSKKSVFACDIDGGDVEKIAESGSLSLLPAWDASGRYLLYTSYVTGRALMYRRAMLSGVTEAISQKKGLNIGAAVSPDGKKIALTLSVDGNTEIYVMDWDGRNLTRLTNSWGQDVSPTWSPDGKRIAFVSSRSGAPHIYTMKADGSEQTRLTFRGTYNQEPDWSPREGGPIVFTARDEKLHYDLFSVSPQTGELIRLTQDAGDNDGPSFAPDGHHIVFGSTRGPSKSRELYVMDADGRKARAILPEATNCETPAWGPRLGY